MEEVLIFVHGVVLVHVFHIRSGLVGGGIAFATLAGVWRVAFHTIDALIAVQNGCLFGIVVGTTEIVVVVASRVVIEGVVNVLIHFSLKGSKIVGIDAIVALISICQTVETNILLLACTAFCGEGINHTLRIWHASPSGLKIVGAIHRHTTLVEFLTILQDVFAHVTEVDVEITTIVAGFVASVDEWVEQPEFDVLHVGCLKIAGIEFSHHTTPTLRWVVEASAIIHIGVEVIRTTLVWIVSKVENRQRVAFSLVHILVWIYFTNKHLSHIVVGELVEVALDVSWGKRRTTTSEERVDIVPSKERTVVAVHLIVAEVAILQVGWSGGESPRLRTAHVDAALGGFEVVNV